MDVSKRAAFVRRTRMAKGGMVRGRLPKKYFADGGVAQTIAGNPNASNPNTGILGTIGGALGLNNQFQATGANITPGTNAGQLNTAYATANQNLNGLETISNTTLPTLNNALLTQNQVLGQEQQIANGQGPNPAMTQLATTTGQNIAAQTAAQAGQRGASGNVGLIARGAAQQGAATQQAAVGQAATLEAQQQIQAQQNEAALAAQQVQQAQTAAAGTNSAVQNEQSILQGANTAANNANVGMQSNINTTNAGVAAGNSGLFGSILGGVGSASSGLSKLFSSEGGEIEPLYEAHGGSICTGPHKSHVMNYLFGGGETEKVPAMVSPGEIYLSPDDVKKVVEEDANPLKLGRKFKGEAKVKGDSLKNDTISEDLPAGGVVLPRHIAAAKKQDPEKAKRFVQKSMAKKRVGGA